MKRYKHRVANISSSRGLTYIHKHNFFIFAHPQTVKLKDSIRFYIDHSLDSIIPLFAVINNAKSNGWALNELSQAELR
jgi:hypothetical protein